MALPERRGWCGDGGGRQESRGRWGKDGEEAQRGSLRKGQGAFSERGGFQSRGREEAGKGAETSLAGPDLRPLSPSTRTLFSSPCLMQSALGSGMEVGGGSQQQTRHQECREIGARGSGAQRIYSGDFYGARERAL